MITMFRGHIYYLEVLYHWTPQLYMFLFIYFYWCVCTAAFVLILLLLSHLHKKSTQKERAKLRQTRMKTQKISDQTTMTIG